MLEGRPGGRGRERRRIGVGAVLQVGPRQRRGIGRDVGGDVGRRQAQGGRLRLHRIWRQNVRRRCELHVVRLALGHAERGGLQGAGVDGANVQGDGGTRLEGRRQSDQAAHRAGWRAGHGGRRGGGRLQGHAAIGGVHGAHGGLRERWGERVGW